MQDRPFLSMDISNPTWWAYVALLILAVYFRFSRVFSVRNLDLILLILLSTALTATVSWQDRVWTGKILPDPRQTETDRGQKTPAGVIPVSMKARSAGDEAGMGSSEKAAIAAPSLEGQTTAMDGGNGKAPASVHPISRWGALGLLLITAVLLVRLMLDESLTRRPRLDQNLNFAGLTFLCIPAFGILMAHVALLSPHMNTQKAMLYGKALLERQDVRVDPKSTDGTHPAPTETLVAAGGNFVGELADKEPDWIARGLVITAHTLVVLGLLAISRWHFSSLQLGVSMSCLYLLLPCTGVYVHQLSHVLPAACLIWAFASYRKPVIAGILLGFASGTLFFAAFLLPLWAVFYGRRGGLRFLISVMAVVAILVTSLMFISRDASSFTNKLITTANWTVYRLLQDPVAGVDTNVSHLMIRIIMAALFFVMLTAMTVLPRPRNLENLLANSTCLIVAAQLWYPDDIGHYVIWYLPLLLLVIFRPRLDHLIPPRGEEPSAAVGTAV
jgi:hypothetical protein